MAGRRTGHWSEREVVRGADGAVTGRYELAEPVRGARVTKEITLGRGIRWSISGTCSPAARGGPRWRITR